MDASANQNGASRRTLPGWWKTLGWESEQALRRDWAGWYETRRQPPRMPLMILADPPTRPRNGGG